MLVCANLVVAVVVTVIMLHIYLYYCLVSQYC